MSKMVFVTGGSGFVGRAVIDELLARGHSIHALVNRKDLPEAGERVKSFRGGLFDPAAIRAGMVGCDAVIHLVGIIMEQPGKGITFERIHFEGTKNIVNAAKEVGIQRYVQMSALGTRADAVSQYHRTKWLAEEYLRASGLDWTIIRPSMIHGPSGDFMQMEAKWVRKQAAPFLFMPYFGRGLFGSGGAGMLQPVDVKDVARAFVDALDKPGTIRQTYELGGSQQLTWPQMHQTAARLIAGKKRWIMPLPAWYAKAITFITPAFLLPFNRDQVIMSQEENTCDLSKFITDFGWEPAGFDASLAGYAGKL